MRLAIARLRSNVESATGDPVGAAIFEARSDRLVVVRLNNCTLHGEMMAFMMGPQRVGSYTSNGPNMPNMPNMPAHELYTSCESCAICLGATLWSGVERVVYGAARDDATLHNFEEGPVFHESYPTPRSGESAATATSFARKPARCSRSGARGAAESTTRDEHS